MKFEYLLGTEGMFFGNTDSILAIVRHNVVNVTFVTDIKQLPSLSGRLVALRRPVPEPAHWTQEDKDAGRLPEAGDNVVIIGVDTREVEFIGLLGNPDFWVYRELHGECGYAHFNCFKPIETPEEKAARLENEFIARFSESDPIPCGTGRQIFERGLRAAYRELQSPVASAE